MDRKNTYDELVAQNEHLQSQLTEALEIINAIRTGEVDALVVKQNNEHQLFTLKTADQTYRLFIEKMTDGAVTLNIEGVVLYANSRFAQMLDKALEKVIGVPFYDLVPDSFRAQVANDMKKAWVEERKSEITLPGRDKVLPVMLSMNKLESEQGITLSIIVTDLSFQKEAQKQKMALDRKDDFISIASHELKTPVTSIKGYIQILRHSFIGDGNSKAEALLGRAEAQVNKLTSLIQDLLDVKKIETGQLAFQNEIFNFNVLANETIDEMSQGLNMQEIRYAPEAEWNIYGDRNKIGQVVSNFIDNASKYSPPESLILVHARQVGKCIRLSVTDRGIGIPEEQQEKIFDRFFRVNSKMENTYSGLGLGLYICSDIIKRHLGKIGVSSTPGKGSTFYFELPLAETT